MITAAYEISFTVTQDECDMFNRMKLGAILRRTQQISTEHCNSNGLTSELYEKTNTVFLLAKSQLDVFANIVNDDEVIAKTVAYGAFRAMYMRTVEFYVNGKLMAVSDGRWILIDTKTKRIMRRPPEEIYAFFLLQPTELPPLSIEKAEKVTQVASLKSLFSMCDINLHINNTVYADIVCDNLPSELYNEHISLKRLVMVYHNEIPFNVSFKISRGEVRDNCIYFACATQENGNFEANLLY